MTTQTGHYGLSADSFPEITIKPSGTSIDRGRDGIEHMSPKAINVLISNGEDLLSVDISDLVDVYRNYLRRGY